MPSKILYNAPGGDTDGPHARSLYQIRVPRSDPKAIVFPPPRVTEGASNMDWGHPDPPQEGDFGETHWTEMASYGSGNSHTSPVHEYQGFQFGSPPIMPMEPSYNMSIPPPYTSHQQLQPLIMPQWPSMLASQSNFTGTPITSASTSTPISASSATSSQSNHIPTPVTATSTGSTPRRTLTDADRRAMCVYHAENPTVKQTEIGGKLANCSQSNTRANSALCSNVWCGTKVTSLSTFCLSFSEPKILVLCQKFFV